MKMHTFAGWTWMNLKDAFVILTNVIASLKDEGTMIAYFYDWFPLSEVLSISNEQHYYRLINYKSKKAYSKKSSVALFK